MTLPFDIIYKSTCDKGATMTVARTEYAMHRVIDFIHFAHPYNSYSIDCHTLILVFKQSGLIVRVAHSYKIIEGADISLYYLVRTTRKEAYTALSRGVTT